MKIEADGEEKIAVTLTERDMQDFDITYDEMDYSNIETRRVIWTILDEAKRVLGKPINIDNRLLIQVSPGEDGGCIMHFSQLNDSHAHQKKRLVMKKDAEPVVFCAFDCNSFIDAIRLIRLTPSGNSTEFYISDEDYYAIVHPLPGQTERLLTQLCEFGEVTISCKKELARIYETGKSLS
ncbi:MAG: adaptor protein MecA [Clostridia bacterium]|nr:adaptor protein MecA [Clostridia bacterium]